MKKDLGCIFDMDGTLTDSMGAWRGLCDKYLISNGKIPEPNLIEKLKPMSLKQSAEYFQARYGIRDPWRKIIDDEMKIMEAFYRNDVELKPGAAALLDHFKNAGARMCIASATERPQVEIALERTGIRGYFDFIITCSESTGKDEPGIYEEALERLGTPKEGTVVLEDAYYAVKTAAGAGFRVYGIYDATAKRNREKISGLCEYYAEDPEDLLKQLGQ